MPKRLTPAPTNSESLKNLRRGNPGNKGGGNTSTAYKLWLTSLLQSPKHQKAFVSTIQDPAAPQFLAATKHAAAYAHGLPIQAVQVQDTTPRNALAGEALAELLLHALPLLLQGRPALAQQLTGQAAVDAEYTIEE